MASIAADQRRLREESPPEALSLVFEHPACSEEDSQRRIASQLDLPQQLLTISEAVGPQGLIRAALTESAGRPAPLLNLWAPAYHALGALGIERGCGTILTGNGGDEWLEVGPFVAADMIRSGDLVGLYGIWNSMRRSYPLSAPHLARNLVWNYGIRSLAATSAARALNKLAPGAFRYRRLRNIRRRLPTWIAPDAALRRSLIEQCESTIRETDCDGFYLSGMREALDTPVTTIEREEFFESGRRMGSSLTHPFYDADLVAYLFRTPPKLLMRGGRSKGLVREALAKRFPDLGFERHRKLSATNFFQSVMLEEGVRAWREMGGARALADLGIVDGKGLGAAVEALCNVSSPLSIYRLWHVLTVESWLRARV